MSLARVTAGYVLHVRTADAGYYVRVGRDQAGPDHEAGPGHYAAATLSFYPDHRIPVGLDGARQVAERRQVYRRARYRLVADEDVREAVRVYKVAELGYDPGCRRQYPVELVDDAGIAYSFPGCRGRARR